MKQWIIELLREGERGGRWWVLVVWNIRGNNLGDSNRPSDLYFRINIWGDFQKKCRQDLLILADAGY